MNTRMARHPQNTARVNLMPWFKSFVRVFPYLFAVTVLLYLWGWLKSPATFPIKNVKVYGHFVHCDKASTRSKILPNVLQGFFNVDVDGLRETLLSNEWIADVSITRRWPDTVEVRITERMPVATWNQNGYVSRDGHLFYPGATAQPSAIQGRLIALSGPESARTSVLSMYQNMDKLLMPAQIHLIAISLSDRLSWQISIQSGTTIKLGRDNPLEKLQRFMDVYPNLIHNDTRQLVSADMRYAHGMALKWQ